MTNDEKALAPLNNQVSELSHEYPVLSVERAREIGRVINGNLGPRGLTITDFEAIKVPSGGALHWSVPGLNGEEPHKVLTGFVAAHRDARYYYSKPYGGGRGTPPDCKSIDGFWGEGNPGGECDRCPMAEFGSDPKGGRAQACKQVRQLLFLRTNLVLPNLISIPPTSLKNARQYFLRLASSSLDYWALLTNLSLERATNQDGTAYARVVFTSGTRLSDQERATMRPYAEQMQSVLKPLEVDPEDYVPSQPSDREDIPL